MLNKLKINLTIIFQIIVFVFISSTSDSLAQTTTQSPTPTKTPTPTATLSATPTPTPSSTPTRTPTSSPTISATPTPTVTKTPTPTISSTATPAPLPLSGKRTGCGVAINLSTSACPCGTSGNYIVDEPYLGKEFILAGEARLAGIRNIPNNCMVTVSASGPAIISAPTTCKGQSSCPFSIRVLPQSEAEARGPWAISVSAQNCCSASVASYAKVSVPVLEVTPTGNYQLPDGTVNEVPLFEESIPMDAYYTGYVTGLPDGCTGNIQAIGTTVRPKFRNNVRNLAGQEVIFVPQNDKWLLTKAHWYGIDKELEIPPIPAPLDDQGNLCNVHIDQSVYGVSFYGDFSSNRCKIPLGAGTVFRVRLPHSNGRAYVTKIYKDHPENIFTLLSEDKLTCCSAITPRIWPFEKSCYARYIGSREDQYTSLTMKEEERHIEQLCSGTIPWSSGGLSAECPSWKKIKEAAISYSGNKELIFCEQIEENAGSSELTCEASRREATDVLKFGALMAYKDVYDLFFYEVTDTTIDTPERCWMEYTAKKELSITRNTANSHYQCSYEKCYQAYPYNFMEYDDSIKPPANPCD